MASKDVEVLDVEFAASKLLKSAHRNIAKSVLVCLGQAGRVASLQHVIMVVTDICTSEIDCLQTIKVPLDLESLVSRYDAFYSFSYDGRLYLSLSRAYHKINPRLAGLMKDVSDRQRESVLSYRPPMDASGSTAAKRNLDYAEKFGEYEYAKCALAILEVLNAVSNAFGKKRRKTPFKRVVQKCERLSGLAMGLLRFFSNHELDQQITSFLEAYGNAFKKDGSLLSTEEDILFGLKYAVEMDLLYSYVGVCIVKGLTDIPHLLSEVSKFFKRAKLRHAKELDMNSLVKYLEFRHDMCMLTGDGKVWLIEPLKRVPLHVRISITGFFADYVCEARLNYAECFSTLMMGCPDLADFVSEENSITIASYLYSQRGTFVFNDGIISLNVGDSPARRPPELSPLHVPKTHNGFTVSNQEKPSRIERGTIFGAVIEVGMWSAILCFRADAGKFGLKARSAKEKILNYAFCDQKMSLLKGAPVKDFTLILKRGDYVHAMVTSSSFRNVTYPFYFLVTSFTKAEADSNEPEKNEPPAGKESTSEKGVAKSAQPEGEGSEANIASGSHLPSVDPSEVKSLLSAIESDSVRNLLPVNIGFQTPSSGEDLPSMDSLRLADTGDGTPSASDKFRNTAGPSSKPAAFTDDEDHASLAKRYEDSGHHGISPVKLEFSDDDGTSQKSHGGKDRARHPELQGGGGDISQEQFEQSSDDGIVILLPGDGRDRVMPTDKGAKAGTSSETRDSNVKPDAGMAACSIDDVGIAEEIFKRTRRHSLPKWNGPTHSVPL